jgi:hypothetical protein
MEGRETVRVQEDHTDAGVQEDREDSDVHPRQDYEAVEEDQEDSEIHPRQHMKIHPRQDSVLGLNWDSGRHDLALR